MITAFVLDTEIAEDGEYLLRLPKNAPRGRVRIIVEPLIPLDDTDTSDLGAEVAAFFRAYPNGKGLRSHEIAESPAVGGWADRDDISSGADYVEQVRSKRRYSW